MTSDLEIGRRLDAYASVRLAPSALTTARMRARVMREVRLEFSARAAALAAAPATEQQKVQRRSRAIRRGGGLLLAAALSLGVAGGAMAAAQPGGLLYPTRMWLETITLPADAAARTDAEIVRLEARLNEVIAAARSGDPGAVAAALAAYAEIADEALAGAGGDAAAIDRLRLALDRHLAVLATVAAKVPAQAGDAIERNIDRAILHNATRLERMEGKPGGPASNQGGGPGQQPGQQPAQTAKPEKSPRATPAAQSTPRPAATPRAQPTERPTKPPKAPPTPKPDKVPPGQDRAAAP